VEKVLGMKVNDLLHLATSVGCKKVESNWPPNQLCRPASIISERQLEILGR
jgi:hypothetical protein